jgi:Fe2+ transport system protein FeoA
MTTYIIIKWSLNQMTMLNQLKSGDFARIINIDCEPEFTKKFINNGITEGNIIRIISSFGLITFNVNSRIFSISNGLAKNVRVIKLSYQHQL